MLNALVWFVSVSAASLVGFAVLVCLSGWLCPECAAMNGRRDMLCRCGLIQPGSRLERQALGRGRYVGRGKRLVSDEFVVACSHRKGGRERRTAAAPAEPVALAATADAEPDGWLVRGDVDGGGVRVAWRVVGGA